MFKSINAIEFNRRFVDNRSCYDYLIERKWGKGFCCSFCGCQESYKAELFIIGVVRAVYMMRALLRIPYFTE